MVGRLDIQVNLGCGDHYQDGWVNYDRSPSVKCDVRYDVRLGLPYEDHSVPRIYAGHFLEHLSLDDVAIVLAEVARVLAKDGEFMVVGPDYTRALSRGEPEAILEGIRGGAGRWEGDTHQWTATGALTRQALGPFFHVTEVDIMDTQGWPVVSRIGWQCAFLCLSR